MKRKVLRLRKASLLIAVTMLAANVAFGAIFTATTNGNWSESATWGGSAPSFNITGDQITIPSGISVTMDNNVTINGTLASVTIGGTLTDASNNTGLTVSLGTLAGNGNLIADTLTYGIGAIVSFTGNVTANVMSNWALLLQSSANVMVNNTLGLGAGNLQLTTGGMVNLGNNATIVVAGGTITQNGGNLNLTNSYNVSYINSSATTGIELNGAMLNNLNVDVTNSNSVTLASNIAVAGTLSLTTGTLMLDGWNLTINGDVAAGGTGSINAALASDLAFNTTWGITGLVNFSGNNNWLTNLTVNVGNGYQVMIGGNISVQDSLMLTSGTLNFNGANLTINGNVWGSGNLSGNASSNLTINTTGGLSEALSFAATGQWLNNLTINVGSGDSVGLATNLTTGGTLTLTGGSNLNISGISLTMNGDLSGTGSLIVNSNSGLTINTTNGLSSNLNLSGSSIGNLNVNVGNTSSVSLGNSITVSDSLSLSNGILDLNGNNLTITGNVSAYANNGIINSNSASDITLNSTGITGMLMFSSTGNYVNNFTVNITGQGASVMVMSDLWVDGNLTLTSGTVNMADNTLWIGSSGMITGGSSNSYIITGANGSLAMSLTAGNANATLFPVGTMVRYYPANVQLNVGSSSGHVMVGAFDHVWSGGTSGANISTNQPLVDATWIFDTDISSNLSLDMWLEWSNAAEINGFDRTHAYISHYTNSAWDFSPTSSAMLSNNMWVMERMNLTSLSPFAVFDNNTITTNVGEIRFRPEAIELYPNPTTGDFIIESGDLTNDEVYMDVIDMYGQIVGNYRLTNDLFSFSLQGFAQGNYFLRFYNDKINVIKKITKI